MTSFVSHVAPFEDLRGAVEQTEPAIGAPLPFQDDSHVHLPRVEVQGRSVSRSDGHHGTEGALGPLGRVMAASCCLFPGRRMQEIKRRLALSRRASWTQVLLRFCFIFLFRRWCGESSLPAVSRSDIL